MRKTGLRRIGLIGVLLAGLGLRFGLLTLDIDSLICVVPDDAFYYLRTAQHIAQGHGVTFDGTNPTNGFHPLWMMLLSGLAYLIPDSWMLFKASLGFSILLNTGSALGLYLILKRFTDRWWIPPLGTALYFLNPQGIINNLNGLETSLSSFLFCASLGLVLRSPPATLGRGRALGIGATLGLLFLARTDQIFSVIALIAGIGLAQAPPLRLKRLAGILGATLCVVSPWLAWDWIHFGTFMQHSGLAIPTMSHEWFRLEGHSSIQMLARSAWLFVAYGGKLLYIHLGFPRFLYLGAIAGAAWIFTRGWRSSPEGENRSIRHAVRLLLLLGGAGLLLILSHAGVRWAPRPWYFDPLILLSAFGLGLGLIVSERTSPLGRHRIFVATVGTLWAGSLALGAQEPYRRPYTHQQEMLEGARWLKSHLPAEETVGAFNAGIYSYFSAQRVVNLDGAINSAAYQAIRNKQLQAFLSRAGIRYYIDYNPVMWETYRPFLGDSAPKMRLSLLKEIDWPDVGGDWGPIRAYRIDWTE